MTTAETTRVDEIKGKILDKIEALLSGTVDDQMTVATLAGAYRQLADASS